MKNKDVQSKVNILLVDDDSTKQQLLETILEHMGANLVKAASGREALSRLQALQRSILNSAGEGIMGLDREGRIRFINAAAKLLGYPQDELEGQSSHDALHHCRESGDPLHPRDCPIYQTLEQGVQNWVDTESFTRQDGTVFPCQYASAPIQENGQITGAVVSFVDTTARRELEERLQDSLDQLQQTLKAAVTALTTEYRDPYTAGHQERVAHLAGASALELHLPEKDFMGLMIAASVHDMGKMAVPAEILSKPGKLTEMEMNLIRVHPSVAYDILKDLEFPWPVAQIVLQHHERLDGSGYPQGLKGDRMLLEAKIIGVADVVEAMASHRPYRPARGIAAALEEISGNRGKLYDSEVADACLGLFARGEFSFS